MWGAGPWEASGWTFWWIFPLIGLVMCIAFMVMMVRAMTGGHGFMCMGGHRQPGSGEAADLRREIHGLREEVDKLKARAEGVTRGIATERVAGGPSYAGDVPASAGERISNG